MANRAQPAVGIDLGTTYCCVAVCRDGKVEVIANDQGNRTTPSMVAFNSHERLLGEGARHQISTNARNTVFDVKRLIGRRFTDPVVQSDISLWPFKVVSDTVGQPFIEVEYKGETKKFAPQEISSMILDKMKKTASDFLNVPVETAVVTVPAYFNDAQRKATKDAATIAGLHVSRILNEPSAAAIAYGFKPDAESRADRKRILVFDLGGGTFDVSIVELHRGKFDVKGVGGDMHLGGEDFDNNLLDFCVRQFKRKNASASDVGGNPKAMRRLRTECERAKRTLSTALETVVDIDALHEGCDITMSITKSKFEELNVELFMKCVEIVKSSIGAAGMQKEEIDEIVLVGGSSRIPKVQELLHEFFEGKSLCKNLNPDEAVATGAAFYASSLGEEEPLLRDVTPLSLGVSVSSGLMNIVVPRNTPLPVKKERRYTTRYDEQTDVFFPVYEGERTLVRDNNLLGEFRLTGVPPSSAGNPDIKVVFIVDENGMLTVTAREEKSGVSNQIVISNDSGRLTASQIERMVEEAQRFKRDDEETARSVLAKNNLQSLINNMKSRLRISTVREQIGVSEVQKIQEELVNAELWVQENERTDVRHVEQMHCALRDICSLLSYHRSAGDPSRA